jgi:hypothetical protein
VDNSVDETCQEPLDPWLLGYESAWSFFVHVKKRAKKQPVAIY